MKNSSHLGFWFAFAILLFFASPLLRAGSKMEVYVLDEIQQTRSALGERVGNFVVSFANATFTGTPLGAMAKTAQSIKHTPQEVALGKRVAGPGGEVISSVYNNYLQGLVMQTYVVAMRLAIVVIWLIVLAPMLSATFTVAGIVVIPLLAMPVVYLVLPFTLSPLLAPLWALLLVLPLSFMISNMQPLFGR